MHRKHKNRDTLENIELTSIMTPQILRTSPHAASLGPQKSKEAISIKKMLVRFRLPEMPEDRFK